MNLSVKLARKGHIGHTDSLLIDLLMLCPHTGFNSTASLSHMTDLNFRVVGCHSESDQAKGNRKSLVDVHHSILTGLEGGKKRQGVEGCATDPHIKSRFTFSQNIFKTQFS